MVDSRYGGSGDRISRRALMQGAFAAAAAGMVAPNSVNAATGAGLKADPFQMLGAASGDPHPNGVVLWCRLALDLEDGARWGLSDDAYRVGWEIRDLERSGRPIAAQGTAIASADKGYAVHVEAAGLQPSTRYAYRFSLGDYATEGLTRTAPAAGSMPEKLRFAFCSCAEYEFAYPHAYELMARDEPAFIVHLGDYIYEKTYDEFYRFDAPPPLRRPGCENLSEGQKRARFLKFDRTAKLKTLSQFRRRYAEHKSDPRLQYAHRTCPFIVTWDDHEVENDYAADFSEVREAEDFIATRIAAYRAYFENMPVRLSVLPVVAERRQLYRAFDFGNLLRLNMLDERQYRSDQACAKGLRGNARTFSLGECPEIEAMIGADGTAREMLGKQQSRWLERQFDTSKAVWNVLAQGVMMAAVDSRADCNWKEPRTETMIWNDGWGGYTIARQRVVDLMEKHRAKNPIVLSGDVHAHFVTRVLKDWKDQQSVCVAPEFTTTAISSFLRNLEPWAAPGGGNERTIVDLDCRHHGYVVCDLTTDTFDVTAKRITPNAIGPDTASVKSETSYAYRVTAGDPEPRKI